MPQARDEAGNIWEVDAQGNPVRLVQAAGGPQMPANPAFPYQGPQAAAEVAKTQAQGENSAANAIGQTIQNTVAQATIPAQVQKAAADAVTAQIQAQGGSANVRQDAIQQHNGADQLDAIADDLERQYNANFKGKGIGALNEYNPLRSANKVFNDTANQARGFIKNALGYTGGEGNTIGEVQLNYGPYLPQNGDRDEQIVQKIGAMRALAARARQRATETLGGVPGPDGKITPAVAANAQQGGNPPTTGGPPASPFDSNPGGGQAVATGATRSVFEPAVAAGLNAMVQHGRPYEEAAAFAAQHGFPAPSAQEYGAALAWQRAHPNAPYDASNPTREVPTTGFQRFVGSPAGAAAVGVADMGSFGVLPALAGDRMRDLATAQPGPTAIGQVLGALGGTAGLGGLGRATIGRALPQLMVDTGRGRFLRNLATDTAYSGIYGGVSSGGDPSTAGIDALGGAFGSIGGQAIGSGLGKAVSGVTSSPTIARLRAQGITPTIGQIARGRAADRGGNSLVAGVEDVIGNTGAVGGLVNAGRTRALEDANLAAFNIGSDGVPITRTGVEGLGQLGAVKDNAYSAALDGVTVPATDPTYVAGVTNAARAGEAVDKARGRGDFTYILDNRLNPILGSGLNFTGQQLQDALRLLQGQSRAYRKAATGVAPDPAASGVAEALDQVGDALTDLAGNYSPDTLPKLNDANRIYRGLRVLDDAAERGMNDGGLFTGAQLGQAIKANTGKFEGRGLSNASRSPFFQLQQDMQTVLPNKIPPTGVNAAPALALGSAALGGAGVATDNDYLKAAGLLALTAAPYTKAGQKALAKVLLDRPAVAKQVGNYLRRRAGVFGSAAIPFALPS